MADNDNSGLVLWIIIGIALLAACGIVAGVMVFLGALII